MMTDETTTTVQCALHVSSHFSKSLEMLLSIGAGPASESKSGWCATKASKDPALNRLNRSKTERVEIASAMQEVCNAQMGAQGIFKARGKGSDRSVERQGRERMCRVPQARVLRCCSNAGNAVNSEKARHRTPCPSRVCSGVGSAGARLGPQPCQHGGLPAVTQTRLSNCPASCSSRCASRSGCPNQRGLPTGRAQCSQNGHQSKGRACREQKRTPRQAGLRAKVQLAGHASHRSCTRRFSCSTGLTAPGQTTRPAGSAAGQLGAGFAQGLRPAAPPKGAVATRKRPMHEQVRLGRVRCCFVASHAVKAHHCPGA